jgi:hypothetical protein
MPAIDFTKPLRIKATGRRLHAGWHGDTNPRSTWVALHPDPKRSGFRYFSDGTPYDEGCPWGEIENFEEGSPFETVETVLPQDAYNPEALARKREREHNAMLDAMGDDDAWGMF